MSNNCSIELDVRSSFVLPPLLAEKYRSHANMIGAAPPSERLDVFTRVAQVVAGMVGDDFPKQEAVDRLYETATAHGLLNIYDDDVLQVRLADAFGDPIYSNEVLDDDADRTSKEIRRLGTLGTLDYERERKSAVNRLNIRAPILDRLVAAEREEPDDGKQGRALILPEPEPWPDTVNGANLLDALSVSIRRHVVMSDHAADTAALWTVHTYLLDALGISPRLAVTSPEKGCGKTTLLDVLSCLVQRPLPTANATASAIFRVVEMRRPTLLIDEGETFLLENEELRGILNSGHRRGGSVIRTVGDDFEPRSFSTYSACAIALIGRLPTTLEDRSVSVELRRRMSDEAIEAFRFDRTQRLRQLARKAARWAVDNTDAIRDADPDMPAGVFNRMADNWRPLLAIADAVGGEWPARARRAVQRGTALAGGDEQSVRALLLADIRTIFAERGAERLASAELVAALAAIEGRPWAEWRAGKPITANSLARLLAPFAIVPDTIRLGDRTPKGYGRHQFEDAFARYLPQENV
jgi:putative DNA primase/helicase